jgi:DNA-binding MarR family transcriptional regulator
MGACEQRRRALAQPFDGGMAPSGVRATQLPILVAVGSAGDVSVTMLAEALALDGRILSRNLKVLEDRGLIRIAGHEEDARVQMVSLTLEGSRVLAGALARLPMQQSVVAQLGRPRLRALYAKLDALSAAVSE